MNLSEFSEDLIQSVRTRCQASGDAPESAFTELVVEYLQETGDVSDFVACSHHARGIKLDGFAMQSEEATLDLFVSHYSEAEKPWMSLSRAETLQAFKRAETFFLKCLTARFLESLDAVSPEGDAARQINAGAASIRRVRFYLFTNGLLSDKVKEIPGRLE